MTSNQCFVIREKCPVCGSKNTREIYSSSFLKPPIKDFLMSFYPPQGKIEFNYLKSAKYILKECANCETIFQKEIPDNFLMTKIYEEWINPQKAYLLSQKKDSLNKFINYAQEVIMLIKMFNKPPNELDFLDFGMGWGKWCRVVKSLGGNVFGTEISKSRINHAKSQGISVITLKEISKRKFDFINTEQVFEHVSEPLELLNYLKKSLKPSGIIKISVPDGKDIKKRLNIGDWSAPKSSKLSLNSVSPLEHINCFKRSSIVKMAHLAGLRRITIPISIQLSSSVNWVGLIPIIKNLLRPIYLNFYPSGTILFFTRSKK